MYTMEHEYVEYPLLPKSIVKYVILRQQMFVAYDRNKDDGTSYEAWYLTNNHNDNFVLSYKSAIDAQRHTISGDTIRIIIDDVLV